MTLSASYGRISSPLSLPVTEYYFNHNIFLFYVSLGDSFTLVQVGPHLGL